MWMNWGMGRGKKECRTRWKEPHRKWVQWVQCRIDREPVIKAWGDGPKFWGQEISPLSWGWWEFRKGLWRRWNCDWQRFLKNFMVKYT